MKDKDMNEWSEADHALGYLSRMWIAYWKWLELALFVGVK